MSETNNEALVDALVKFKRWCDGGGLDYEAALAAATKRAEEYREKIEQLETDKANYHDKWWNALEKLRAAEQENARLREVIRHIWVHTNGRKLGLSKLPADAMAAYQEIVKPLKNELRFISDEANLHKDRPDA